MPEEYRDGNNEASYLKIPDLQNHIYIRSSNNHLKLIHLPYIG